MADITMIAAVVAGLALGAAQVSSGPLTVGEMKSMRAEGLVSRLLDPEAANRVRSSSLRPNRMIPNTWGFTAYENAAVTSEHHCARVIHGAYFRPVEPGQRPMPDDATLRGEVKQGLQIATTFPEVATAEACDGREHGWAEIAESQLDISRNLLTALEQAVREAGERGRLPFEVTCRAEGRYLAECRKPRHALANLPLDTLMRVRPVSDRRIEDRSTPGVAIIRPAAPTGGRWRQAEFQMRSPPGSPEVWFATLHLSETGEIASVDLRRSLVVFH